MDAAEQAQAEKVEALIARYGETGGQERANYIPFLNDLCDAIGVPRPDAAIEGGIGRYQYERNVKHREADGSATTRRIDLYRSARFILEAKQASNAPQPAGLFGLAAPERRATVRRSPGWVQAMLKAKGQAEGYVRDLPTEEPAPPFLIVCDVGFCFDLYADFSGTGRHYAQFPDREGFRIYVTDLRRPEVRAKLRAIWTDPMSLDPARHRVEVTRDIARLLAKLARAMEGPKDKPRHAPKEVATFLTRCIFTMFAQSVGLLPAPDAFSRFLQSCAETPALAGRRLATLWGEMDKGSSYSEILRGLVLRFNGGLFRAGGDNIVEVMTLDADAVGLLITAANKEWSLVEPAIFGTLLEDALAKRERAELGAHFTPRAFVERLVVPAVMDPLREEWDAVKASATERADRKDLTGAAALVRAFHAALCGVRVLDPACGTGNFLYVTMELMKRLEGEVLDFLADLAPAVGERLNLEGVTVDPHQFLGIEKNPRAVPVAELVLWIGYLQWHFRTRGKVAPAEPILRDFRNIEGRDALLAYTHEEPERDARGVIVTKWGGGRKLHPITGEDIRDAADQVPVMCPVAAKPAAWPEADFIIGNPPFIAGKDMRAELGSGYARALWKAYPKVPPSADLALHFWWKAAEALRRPKARLRRFGFITSNSIRQVFCRRVVAAAMAGKAPLHLAMAIPDHPWADGTGTAAVRIAMTVAAPGPGEGVLLRVVRDASAPDGVPLVTLEERRGRVNADLSIGTDVKAAKALRANERICSPGVKLHGGGFLVTPGEAARLGLGRVSGLEAHIRPYLNGRDLQQRPRGLMVVDMFGLTEPEVRRRYPDVWQHLESHVKPQRDGLAANGPDAAQYARDWHLLGKPRPELRRALEGLPRFIATVETTKHRVFSFLPAQVLPDNKLIVFGADDPFTLGVLQSALHVAWMMAQGNWLGAGNDPVYVKTQSFDPFPFPITTLRQRAEIGAVAEELDALRKARIAAHKHLTFTALYNVLAALREGRALSPAEKDVHDAGHVSILRTLHDGLDAAVLAAYGWPATLTDAEIVARVVALNAERVAEEADGLVRWLRPAFQAPKEAAPRPGQSEMPVGAPDAAIIIPWPKAEPAQYALLRRSLHGTPATPRDLARRFKGAPKAPRLAVMLETLAGLGQARPADGGRYVA